MSLSVNQIKFINSLSQKKYRVQHAAFIIEGDTMVSHVLKSDLHLQLIAAVPAWIASHQQELNACGCEVVAVSENELQKISQLTQANAVLAVASIPAVSQHRQMNGIVLLLDQISNPGNLGTIIRLADWFGVSSVICSDSCVDCFNPKVVQATMGAIATVPVIYCDAVEFLKSINNIPVYAAVLGGSSVYSISFNQPAVLIIGNESRGVSKELMPFVTEKIMIPSFSTNPVAGAESLNAATATAILLSEMKRSSC